MIKRVNYLDDFVKQYAPILQGAYEKANIWPECGYKTNILEKEMEEVELAFDEFINFVYNSDNSAVKLFEPDKNKEAQGYIISLMCELLQVIAVLNKYETQKDGDNQ